MHLKTLKLHNIRSYTDEEINFPKSSIMLSGDIGSGKSTLLLAIEFAFFGIMRGELNGDSLLRKGTTDGSVTLSFFVNGADYEITRGLKKSTRGINQTAGELVSDAGREELTPVELKSRVLDILGYPASLAGKTLLYRYTVYTPQEEMKRVILEHKETRLDILRKAFNLEKYRTAKENIGTYSSELRDDLIVLKTKIEQLMQRVSGKGDFEKALMDAKTEFVKLDPESELLAVQIKRVRERLVELEKQRSIYAAAVELAKKNGAQLTSLKNQLTSTTSRLTQLRMQKPPQKLEMDVQGLENRLVALQEEIVVLEKNQREQIQKSAELDTQIRASLHLQEKMGGLNHCPVCLQDVGEGHKHSIVSKENSKIKDYKVLKEKCNIDYGLALKRRREELLKIQQSQQAFKMYELKLKQFSQTIEQVDHLVLQEKQLKEQIAGISLDTTKIPEFDEQGYLKVKSEELELIRKEKEFAAKKATLQARIENYIKQIEDIVVLQKQLTGYETEHRRVSYLQGYLKDHFSNVLVMLEQHVLFKIQQEFSSLFSDWFSVIIDDDHMSARVDENFSPVIEQNGYDMEFMDLSGGEKTSVALSYRLALNHIINTLVSSIHTKDLLVLDEPTDGFSNEQLDKLKDVLGKLSIAQILLVSHESKVESFVDCVIRVEKQENVSRCIAWNGN